MLVSSIVIEIKILLIDQTLDHFVRHTVQYMVGTDVVGGGHDLSAAFSF
jgi:hypothetical protein